MKFTVVIPKKSGLRVAGKDEDRVKVDIPTTWDQVTFKQYLGLFDAGTDTVKVLAVFTGLDEELIRKAEIKNLSHVTACLHFMTKEMQYRVPQTMLGHKIPTNLETESIAQFADLQEICKGFETDNPRKSYSLFPLIVATYAVSPYNFREAEKIQDKFLNAPCTEVMAVGNFTSVRLRALSMGIVPTSPPVDTRLNRLKQGMINWLQNLVSSIRYYSWKRSLPLNERNYLNGQ